MPTSAAEFKSPALRMIPMVSGGFTMNHGTLRPGGPDTRFHHRKGELRRRRRAQQARSHAGFRGADEFGRNHRHTDGRRICLRAQDHAIQLAPIAAGRDTGPSALPAKREAAHAAAAGSDRAGHRGVGRRQFRLQSAERHTQTAGPRPSFGRQYHRWRGRQPEPDNGRGRQIRRPEYLCRREAESLRRNAGSACRWTSPASSRPRPH